MTGRPLEWEEAQTGSFAELNPADGAINAMKGTRTVYGDGLRADGTAWSGGRPTTLVVHVLGRV